MQNKNKCEDCYKKVTTTGCYNCEYFKIKNCLYEIQEFIDTHKNNISSNYRYVFYFNSKYYNDIISAIDLENIPQKNIKVINLLEQNEVCMIIDLDKLHL